MANVAIVGAGMMGSALAFPARENGHSVRLTGTHLDEDIITAAKTTGRHPKFDRPFPDGVEYFYIAELKSALEGADMVICGVNSFGVDWFMETVMPHIPENVPILSVTKGLIAYDDGSLESYPEYWERKTAPRRLSINAVGGPCTSYELMAHDQTIVSFCGRDLGTLARLRDIMSTDYYHINITRDVIGVEAAVALKNAFALGVALTIGLSQREHGTESPQHYNSQAAAFYQSVKEMRKLLVHIAGSDSELATGVGDLYVTVFGGRTRLIGILLGRGLTMDEALRELSGVTLESLVIIARINRAIKRLVADGRLTAADFPMLMHLDGVVSGCSAAGFPWESFVNLKTCRNEKDCKSIADRSNCAAGKL